MEDKTYKITPIDAMSINIWTFRVTGAWVAGITSQKLRWIYNAYGTVLILVLSFTYFSLEIKYVTVIWGDLEAMSEVSLLLLTHVGNAIKLTNFLMRRGRIEKLVEDSIQDKFMPNEIPHFKYLKSAIREMNGLNLFFFSTTVVTIMGWAIVPMVDKSQRRLPLKTWFPFDTKKSPIFEIIYIYQITAVMMNGLMNGMMDSFVASFMALAGVQIDILRYNISDFKSSDESFGLDTATVDQNVGVKSNLVEVQKRETRENRVDRKLLKIGAIAVAVANEFPIGLQHQDDIFCERIVSCIEHHRAIVRYANEIQDTFGIGILAQFAVSSAILCLTCFQLTLISPSSLQFLSLILYQVCMLTQLYCYCWYGNGLIVKTSDLMTVVFHSPWTSCSPRLKNFLRLMMCRVQEPMQLMVGGLFGLSLETFSSIIRSAYSFFAVLQQAHGEE